MGVFRAYDIRGIYNKEITEKLFEQIGKSLDVLGKAKKLVIGEDMRNSSNSLKKAVIRGATQIGIDVIDIGLASTPMLYQATHDIKVDLGIIITASHNPKEYNGMKICRANAVPISYETGIGLIEANIKHKKFKNSTLRGKVVKNLTFKEQYIKQMSSYGKPKRKLTIVLDTGNGMGGYVDYDILKKYAKIIPLYTKLDGNFPNHEANPIKEKNIIDLSRKVIEEKADFGVAFDGDADRIGLVDERGKYVGADVFGAFLIEYYIKKYPKEKTYSYDLRSTKCIQELLDSHNKKGLKTRVGHSYIKELMRKNNSFFSMELSGHFYFWFGKNMVYDSSLRATIELISAYCEKEKEISYYLKRYKKYPKSNEINFSVSNKREILLKIKKKFSGEKIEEIDGISIYSKFWWANIRESNTEEILRLNIEAENKQTYDKKIKELTNVILNKNI